MSYRTYEDKCSCCKCRHNICVGQFDNCTTYRTDYRGRDSIRPTPYIPRDNLIVGAPIDCGFQCNCKCKCKENDEAKAYKRYARAN